MKKIIFILLIFLLFSTGCKVNNIQDNTIGKDKKIDIIDKENKPKELKKVKMTESGSDVDLSEEDLRQIESILKEVLK